jgi:PhnB protein
MAKVKPIPEGYPQVTPYLCVDGAAAAIEFYCEVFGAKERMRMPGPDGKIGHAEIEIGDSVIMLADEAPEMQAFCPSTIGGTPVSIVLYVTDVDTVFNRALAGGATRIHPLADKFYGDRTGTLLDPFGHMWTIATHKEDVSPEEMQRRAAAEAMKAGGH